MASSINSRKKLYAHRGYGDESTHNSLACFKKAVQNPHIDGSEFDVSYPFLTSLGLVH
jgi:glycerophosphoryl diester phosphodiesterase